MRRIVILTSLAAAAVWAWGTANAQEPEAASRPAGADPAREADELFNTLYKPRIQAAASAADRLSLAKDLLEASRLPEVRGNLHLCDKLLRSAIDLAGRTSAGRETATEAREALKPVQDQLAQAAKAAREQEALAKELAKEKAALVKNPGDKATREKLVRLLVVDLNDPGAAAGFLNDSLDEKWRTYVPMAGKGVEGLHADSCMELGVWYRDLANASQTARGKANTLGRAKACFERFLSLHTGPDAAKLKAKVFLDQTDKDLAKLAKTDQPAPRSQSILADMTCSTAATRGPEGLVIRGELASRTALRSPVRITYIVKTDSTNIRIGYAASQIIFNWEMNRDELRVDGGPAAGQHRRDAGRVPPNKFVTIVQEVGPRGMAISVDGVRRAVWAADFSHVNEPVRIFPMGSVLTVKDVRVERLGN